MKRCADRCNARNDSGKVLGRERPNGGGSSFRDGAMTALGGKISHGCPCIAWLGDIVARGEPQSTSWVSQGSVKAHEYFHIHLHSFTFAAANEKDVRCEISCKIKHFHEAPGWRNWQTQRTQNPPTFGSWGFDSPSRHHDLKEVIPSDQWAQAYRVRVP